MSDLAPSTDNYLVGKGIVYFDRLDADGNSTGEIDLGNDPAFALTPENELLEHMSSREGVKTKDKIAIIASNLNGKFTLDEINIDNLCIALYGDDVEYLNQGDGNVNNEAVTARLSRWVKLDFRKLVAATVVITDAAGAVTYVLNTDYRVDATIGRIYFVAGGNITEGEGVLVDYTYQQASYPYVAPTTRPVMEGLLRFVGNADFGFDYEVVLWKVKLNVGGDINFISDEWSQIEFNYEALDDSTNHPDEPYGMVIDIEGDIETES